MEQIATLAGLSACKIKGRRPRSYECRYSELNEIWTLALPNHKLRGWVEQSTTTFISRFRGH